MFINLNKKSLIDHKNIKRKWNN